MENDAFQFIHHPEGYSKHARLQNALIDVILPDLVDVLSKTASVGGAFTVCDYGAADALNTIPIIWKCREHLKNTGCEERELCCIFNDLPSNDFNDLIKKVTDLLSVPGVTFLMSGRSFYEQVLPANTVDLGVSISSVHWLSRRPLLSDGYDKVKYYSLAKQIAEQDWRNFLTNRAKELKPGGRMVVTVVTNAETSEHNGRKLDSALTTLSFTVIKQMYDAGDITQEEMLFARCVPYCPRQEADIQAPFKETNGDGTYAKLRLHSMKYFHLPEYLVMQWESQGGKNNAAATDAFVTAMVNVLRTVGDLAWTILDRTRKPEEKQRIREGFYAKVGEMIKADPERYGYTLTFYLTELEKVAD